jgi:predicted DNA repair protein MutK
MAASSLLVLIDDIATVLDDVAVLSKVAAKKTAGVLGDDLAVNAEQVSGVRADRELPVVWAVAKGSFRNKLILVPAALLISAFIPWLITPLLMLGGLFLCYEGFEKLAHPLLHSKEEDEAHHRELLEHLSDPAVDPRTYEREKIKGAIRTDFILSAEIIVLTLGIVADAEFASQVLVVAGIAVVMTVGVYGVVAGIIKLDDAGLYLVEREGEGAWLAFQHWLGQRMLDFAPVLMKILGVVGTLAMFMVGGGILVHGVHVLGEFLEHLVARGSEIGVIGPAIDVAGFSLLSALFGVLAGAVVMALVATLQRLRNRAPAEG